MPGTDGPCQFPRSLSASLAVAVHFCEHNNQARMQVEGGLRLSLEALSNGPFVGTMSLETPTDYALPTAVKLDQSTRTLTRRGSDSLTAKPTLNRFFVHSRSHTEAYANGHHPLGSPTCSSSSTSDLGITRPRLNRIVGALDSDSGRHDGEGSVSETRPASPVSDEKVVLVHKISSKDSLPGVALKYGISMADLRRANHLWSSDSIHLRKVLYIPLEKATHYHRTITRSYSADNYESSKTGQSFEMLNMSDGKPSSPIFRRIPASQLSFFPPSSKHNPPTVFSNDIVNVSATRSNSRYTPSPPKTLSSILTSLPIAASTRDTIIARLSFDSSSNTSASDDQELELDDVRQSTGQQSEHKHRSRAPNPWMNTERSKPRQDQLGLSMSLPHPFTAPQSQIAGISMSPMGNSLLEVPAKQRILWAHPDELSQRPANIRTVQLEPSPNMQLPRVPIRPKPRSQEIVGHANSDPDLW